MGRVMGKCFWIHLLKEINLSLCGEYEFLLPQVSWDGRMVEDMSNRRGDCGHSLLLLLQPQEEDSNQLNSESDSNNLPSLFIHKHQSWRDLFFKVKKTERKQHGALEKSTMWKRRKITLRMLRKITFLKEKSSQWWPLTQQSSPKFFLSGRTPK